MGYCFFDPFRKGVWRYLQADGLTESSLTLFLCHNNKVLACLGEACRQKKDMNIKCPYCKSSNLGNYYAKQAQGSAIDLGIALLRSYVTGTPYHTPSTHFGDVAPKQYKCKNCGRIFDEEKAFKSNSSTAELNEEQTHVFETIREIVVVVLGVDPQEVSLNTDFYDDLGADSLDMLEIVIELEKAFHLSDINDEEYEGIRCVEDAVRYIYSKR